MAGNINTLVSSYNGIKSGASVGGRTEEKESLSQLNKAASIVSGASREARPEKISESTLNNTASYLSGARRALSSFSGSEDTSSTVAPDEDIYNRFMETVGPYVNMSENEKKYYYNMSGMIMKNGGDAESWAEDFLAKNAVANVLGVSRSSVEEYMPQMMEYYLGVENEKYLNFSTGATLINSIKQGVRQQEQANAQEALINLYKEGHTDDSPDVKRMASAILQKDREMSYYQDSTPRTWWTEWAKSSLQQLPYMATGTVSGIVGQIIGGATSILIPGIGIATGAKIGGDIARTLTYRKQFEASAFWNMKQAGVSTQTALKYADIDGLINGLNENFLDIGFNQITGTAGKLLGIDGLGGKLIPSVTGALIKNGSLASFMGKFLLWMGLDASGEFVQESTQSLTSAALQAMAEYEDGIRMTYTDKEKVSDAFSQAWDEGVQGFLTGLFFGAKTSAVGVLVDYKTSANLKNTAIKTSSKESYVKNEENRQAVRNLRLGGDELSESQIDELLSGLYESSNDARNELKNNIRKDIFEQLKGIDGTLEESSILNRMVISDREIKNETGEVISGKNTAVKTRDDGSLYFVVDKDTTRSGEGENTTSYTMRIANPSVVGTSALGEVYVDAKVAGYESDVVNSVASSPKALAMEQAGRINFTVNEENKTLTIDSVSVQEDSKTLKTKAIQELTAMYPEYTVEWENRTESDNAVYADIESANPRNTAQQTFGLNYNEKLSSDDADTAYVKRWLGTSFSDDNSENSFMATILQAAAKARGMDGKSFIEKYFTAIEKSDEKDSNTKGYMNTKRDAATKQVKATIYAGKNADATTFLHELHHAIMLMGDNMKEFTQIYNKVKGTKQFMAFLQENIDLLKERIAKKDADGKFILDEKGRYSIDENKVNALFTNSNKWTEDDFEFEARLYEAYVRNGRTFNPSLTGFFRRVAETFRQIYRSLRNGFFKTQLNDEVVEYFDKLYGYDASTGTASQLNGDGNMQFLDDAVIKENGTVGGLKQSESIELDENGLLRWKSVEKYLVGKLDQTEGKSKFTLVRNKNTDKDYKISKRTIGKMLSDVATKKSVANGFTINQHNEAVANVITLFKNATLVETSNDKNGSRSIKFIERFETNFAYKGYNGTYTAYFTAKTYTEKNKKGSLYSVELKDIKNTSDKNGVARSTDIVELNHIGGLDRLGELSQPSNNIEGEDPSVKRLEQKKISSEEQYDAVKEEYYGTDKYMIAPNGRASNLTERQWIQVRTENFKEWFKGSKVVDENGDPLVVLHGSQVAWDVFDMNEARQNSDIVGAFFSSVEEEAETYGYDGYVRKFYLSIQNPAPYDYAYDVFRSNQTKNNAGAITREALMAEGYDGVILREEGENDEYIVFSPNQIKSATDNNGNFSTESDSILKQEEDTQDSVTLFQNKIEDSTLESLKAFSDGNSSASIESKELGAVTYEIGSTGKHGHGMLHIIEKRMAQGKSLEEATDIAIAVAESVASGDITASIQNTRHLDKGGIRAIVAIKDDGNIVVTGYDIINEDEKSDAYRRSETYAPETHVRSDQMVASFNDRLNQLLEKRNTINLQPSALEAEAEDRSDILQVPTESDILMQYAYHGSSADFDEFKLGFIGSGEGSQVFGYGFYFTESDVIARKYADIGYNSSRSYRQHEVEYYKEEFERIKKRVEEAGRQRAEDGDNTYTASAFDNLKRKYAEIKKKYQEALALQEKGSYLYKVIIPDSGYLSWEKDVPEALIKDVAESRVREGYSDSIEKELWKMSTIKTGKDLYGYLAGVDEDRESAHYTDDWYASQALSDVGVVGIKYRAGTIRGLPDNVNPDTYNYVVFNPKNIDIADSQRLKQEVIINGEEGDNLSESAIRNDLESVEDSSVVLEQVGDDEWTETARRIALEAGSLEDFFKLYRERIDSGDVELSDSNTSLLLSDIYEEELAKKYGNIDEEYYQDYEETDRVDEDDYWNVEEEDSSSSKTNSSMPDEVPDWFDVEEEKVEGDNNNDDWVVEDVADDNTPRIASSESDVPDWFDIDDNTVSSISDTAKSTEDNISAVEEAVTEVQKVVVDADLPKGLSLEKSRSLDTSVKARAVEFASILKGSKEETIKFLEALKDVNDEFFYGNVSATNEAVDEATFMAQETRRTAYDDFSNISKFIQNLIFDSRGSQYANRLIHLSDRAWKIVAGQVSANPELYMDLYARASNISEWAGDNSVETKVITELGLTKEEWNKASYYKRKMYVQDVADKEMRKKIMSGKFVDSEIKEWIRRSEEKAEASLAEAKAIEESQKYTIDENKKTILKMDVEAQETQKKLNKLKDEQAELQDRIDKSVTRMERKLKRNGTPTETETAEHGELLKRKNELERRQKQYEKTLESYQNRYSTRTRSIKDSAATASDVERIKALVEDARNKVLELEKKNVLTPEEALERLENLYNVWKDAKTKEAVDEVKAHYQQRLKDATQDKHEALDEQHKKLSSHYQDRLKNATVDKHEALKKARERYMADMKERDALRKTRAEKERLARQIMKAPSASVALEEAKAIKAIQALLDPAYRRNSMTTIDGVTYSVDELKRILSNNPDDPVLQSLTGKQLERLTKKSLNEMTLAEVESIYQTVLKLKEEGIEKRRSEIVQRKAENKIIREALMNELRANPKYEEYGFEGTEDRKNREKTKKNKIRDAWYNTLNMARKAQTLDNGEKGTFYNLLIRKKRLLENEEMRAVMARSKKIDDVIKDNKFNKDSLYKTWTVKLEDGRNVTFTTSELAYVYLSQNNEDNRDALAYGTFINVTERANIIAGAEKAIIGTGKDLVDARNNKIDGDIRALGDWRYNEVLSLAKTVVEGDKALLKLVKAIESDFNDPSFSRVVNLVRKIYNVEVKKEDYYLPISRTDFMGKEPGEDIKADLLNTVPGTKGTVSKGFTKERIKIAPRNQKAIRYDLFKVWTDAVKKQEHFVAMQEYVNQLNSIFEVSNTSNNVLREGIRNTYGENMLKDIDTHILEIADPNAGAVQSDPARDILKAAKGNIYSAYLGWKLSSITNQLITSPAAFFGKVGPIRYAKNLLQMTFSFNKTSEEVFNLSPFMKSRNFDLIAGEIKEAAEAVGMPKYKKVWNNFLEFGLKGLEWVDQYTVVAGWKAIYEQELERLGDNSEENIRKAVQIADEYTQETQPQSNKTELAPLYKNKNEMLNILLQFQTSLNVVWNNLAYDTVHNFKRKDFRTALGTMAGYATAGALLSLAHGEFQPDDDDDDYSFWRTFLYSTVSQGVESIPVFSSYVDSIFGYVVNNEKPSYNTTSITPFPMLASAFESGKYSIQAVKEKNTEALNKAIEKGADALMLGVGLPYSGVRELKAIQDRGVQALIGAR